MGPVPPTPAPPTPSPGPSSGTCTADSSSGACQPCTMEYECGNQIPGVYKCQAVKDPQCISPPPTPPPTPVPAPPGSGFCAADSSYGACTPCTMEYECGNQVPGVYKCQSVKDPRCGQVLV